MAVSRCSFIAVVRMVGKTSLSDYQAEKGLVVKLTPKAAARHYAAVAGLEPATSLVEKRRAVDWDSPLLPLHRAFVFDVQVIFCVLLRLGDRVDDAHLPHEHLRIPSRRAPNRG